MAQACDVTIVDERSDQRDSAHIWMPGGDGLAGVHLETCAGFTHVLCGELFNINFSTLPASGTTAGVLKKFSKMSPKEAAAELLTEVLQNVMDATVAKMFAEMRALGMDHREGAMALGASGICRAFRGLRTSNGLLIGFDANDKVAGKFTTDAFRPYAFFKVAGGERGVEVDLYQFEQDMVDALVLLPISTSTKTAKEWSGVGPLTSGNFGVGFKQVIAALLYHKLEYQMHGTVPKAARAMFGEVCGIRAVDAGGLAAVRGIGATASRLQMIPEDLRVSERRLVQSMVFPGVSEGEIWDIIASSHIVLGKLASGAEDEIVCGAHILPSMFPLHDLGPIDEDHMLLVKSPVKSSRIFINGIRYCDPGFERFTTGPFYDRVILTTSVDKYLDSSRNYGSSGFDGLFRDFAIRFYKRASGSRLKEKLMANIIFDPTSDLSRILRTYDNDCWKQSIAETLMNHGCRLVLKHELDSARASMLWSLLSPTSIDAREVDDVDCAVDWLLYTATYDDDYQSPSGVEKASVFVDPMSLLLESAYAKFDTVVDLSESCVSQGTARGFVRRIVELNEFIVALFEEKKAPPRLLYWDFPGDATELGLCSSSAWYLVSKSDHDWETLSRVACVTKPPSLQNAIVLTPSTIKVLEGYLDEDKDSWRPSRETLFGEFAQELLRSFKVLDITATGCVLGLHAARSLPFESDRTLDMLAGRCKKRVGDCEASPLKAKKPKS